MPVDLRRHVNHCAHPCPTVRVHERRFTDSTRTQEDRSSAVERLIRPQPEWPMAKVNKSTHPASDVRGAGTPRRLPTGARSTAPATRPTALQPTSARGWAARKKLHDQEHNTLTWPGRQPRRGAFTPEGRGTSQGTHRVFVEA